MEEPLNFWHGLWIIFRDLIKVLLAISLGLTALGLIPLLIYLPWICAAGYFSQTRDFNIDERTWVSKLVVSYQTVITEYNYYDPCFIFSIADGGLNIEEITYDANLRQRRELTHLDLPGGEPHPEALVSDVIQTKQGFLVAVTGLEHTLFVSEYLSSIEEVAGLTLDWEKRNEFEHGPGPHRIVQFSCNGGTINTVVGGVLYTFDNNEKHWVFERRFHEPDDKVYGRAWTSVFFKDDSGEVLLTVFPAEEIMLRVTHGAHIDDLTGFSHAYNFERDGRIVRVRKLGSQYEGWWIGLQNERGEVYGLMIRDGRPEKELQRGMRQSKQMFSFSPHPNGGGFYFLDSKGEVTLNPGIHYFIQ